ncbi:hypothetical protein N0V90_000054 [Kalmusia sp. IMI 367209]|nr:hypothetical protein N0V90_000054 [Kalmusia sp. IMI 367209]
MASLMSLSNELKLLIIEQIPRGPPSRTWDSSRGNGEEDGKMSHVEGGKNEEATQEKISPSKRAETEKVPPDHIPYITRALLALSCVNKAFRVLTVPYIFPIIVLHNSEKSGASVKLLANGPYSQLIRKIEYVGYVPLPPSQSEGGISVREREKDTYVPRAENFPAPVRYVLENLRMFKKLEGISVEFSFGEDFDVYHVENVESREDILKNEAELGWRAMMRDTYVAIARNHPWRLRSLEIKNMITKECSSWDTDVWREVLRNLESFSVRFHPGDNRVGLSIGTFDGYHSFIPTYFSNLLPNLTSVSHLSIAGSMHGPLGDGLAEINVADIFGSEAEAESLPQLPSLRSLELDYIFIGSHFAPFLKAHASTLQSVSLTNSYLCISGIGELEYRVATWEEFFDALLETEPLFPHLQTFYIDEKDGRTEWKDGDNVVVERRLAQACMDDRTGHIFMDDDYHQRNEEMWRANRKAYEAFMMVVERNKKGNIGLA